MKPAHIAIACGGTGGHFFPGVAVAEVLRARGHEVLLLVSEKEIDSLALQGNGGFRYERLPAVGMPRLFSPAMIGFSLRFLVLLKRCWSLFRGFRPDAVLGMGGFTSTAPLLMGRWRGAATFIHESNAIPGKANLLNARFSDVVLIGFKACAAHFPGRQVEICGTPIRASLRQPVDRAALLAGFGFDPARPTLLVMGGSQGARGLNEAVVRTIPCLAAAGAQVLHLAGGVDEPMVAEAYRAAGIPARVSAFHHRMEEFYTAADLAVARSGAASLSELAFFGLPAVLLPYPFATADHQTHNAEVFARAGAAELLQEREASAGRLAELLLPLLADRDRLGAMSAAALALAPSDAAECVANLIERSLKP